MGETESQQCWACQRQGWDESHALEGPCSIPCGLCTVELRTTVCICCDTGTKRNSPRNNIPKYHHTARTPPPLILFSPGTLTLLGSVGRDLSWQDQGKAAAQVAEGTSREGPCGWSSFCGLIWGNPSILSRVAGPVSKGAGAGGRDHSLKPCHDLAAPCGTAGHTLGAEQLSHSLYGPRGPPSRWPATGVVGTVTHDNE